MKYLLFVILIIGGLYFFGSSLKSSPAPASSAYPYDDEEYDYSEDVCEERIGEWRNALEEANEKIDNLNSRIEDAQYYSGESYQDMVDALDGLETEDNVYEPE